MHVMMWMCFIFIICLKLRTHSHETSRLIGLANGFGKLPDVLNKKPFLSEHRLIYIIPTGNIIKTVFGHERIRHAVD